MSAASYRPSVSFVPARKWNDRAAEMLKDPDAFYSKAVAETRQTKPAKPAKGRKRPFWANRQK